MKPLEQDLPGHQLLLNGRTVTALDRIAKYPKAIANGFLNFFKDDCIMLAGSLTFFSVMAVIPFCLLLLALFNYILGANEDFLRFFISRLDALFPDITSEFTDKIIKLVSVKGIGGITVLLYAFQSYQLFLSIEFAMKSIFKGSKRRSLIFSLILSILMVTSIILLILISFAASSAISMLLHYESLFPFLQIGKITGFLIGFVVPIILVFISVTALYIIVPKQKIRLKNAFAGAFITTIFLEAAKHIFTILIGEVFDLGLIYGSLTVSIIFFLWVYYSWCIFLIGAETVHLLEE